MSQSSTALAFDSASSLRSVLMSVASYFNSPVTSSTARPARPTARLSPGAIGSRSSGPASVRAQVAVTRRQALAGSLVAFVASRHPAMATAGGPLYEAWVKGDPKNKVLGDCEYGELHVRVLVLFLSALLLVLSHLAQAPSAIECC